MAKEVDAVIDFQYARDAVGMIQDPNVERIHVNAVDTDGNVGLAWFKLLSISPYHYATLSGHTHAVFSVLFSPDGKTLASGSYDGTILFWDLTLNDGSQTPGPDIDGDRVGPDFDGDGAVGFTDFIQFAANFGFSQGDLGSDARYDLDDDGQVGLSDFLIFAKNFGQQTKSN